MSDLIKSLEETEVLLKELKLEEDTIEVYSNTLATFSEKIDERGIVTDIKNAITRCKSRMSDIQYLLKDLEANNG